VTSGMYHMIKLTVLIMTIAVLSDL